MQLLFHSWVILELNQQEGMLFAWHLGNWSEYFLSQPVKKSVWSQNVKTIFKSHKSERRYDVWLLFGFSSPDHSDPLDPWPGPPPCFLSRVLASNQGYF